MNFPKIGILGGGQLGLMLAQAASDWYLQPHFLDSDAQSSAALFHKVQPGSFRDEATVLAFGENYDILSYELEDVNLAALQKLEEKGKAVFPSTKVLALIRNKRLQKDFLRSMGAPTPEYIGMEEFLLLEEKSSWFPSFWKQEVGGYDGKGVSQVKSEVDVNGLPKIPAFLEKAVEIEKELAIVFARSSSGEVAVFPMVEMVFHPEANLVEFLKCPAEVDTEIEAICRAIGEELVEKLELVGLLAIEFFLDKSGKVWVNEMAPRPHNSGHLTMEANYTSQFQQFWRAVLNLPLGDTRQIFPFAAMLNLVGAEGFSGVPRYEGFDKILQISGVYPHIYGKTETRPFRKMGHVNVVAQTLAELEQKVSFVRQNLKITA